MKLSDYFLDKIQEGQHWSFCKNTFETMESDEILVKVLDHDVTTYFYLIPKTRLVTLENDLNELFLDAGGEPSYICYTAEKSDKLNWVQVV